MKFAGYVFGLVLVFFAGLKLGFYLAPVEFVYRDAQYKSSILAFEIKALKSGQIDKIIEGKEIMLDGELANHGRYLESSLNWLLPSVEGDNNQAISHAVEYRINNPYTGPDLSTPDSWNEDVDMADDFVKDVIKGQQENEELKEMVIKKYAKDNKNT